MDQAARRELKEREVCLKHVSCCSFLHFMSVSFVICIFIKHLLIYILLQIATMLKPHQNEVILKYGVF